MGKIVSSLFGGGSGGNDAAAAQAQAEEARKQAYRQQIESMFSGPDAQSQFTSEEDQLSKALNAYYGDQQKKWYDGSERGLRFGAANTGNIGSTEYADEQSLLNEQNQLGSTKIADAVNRAIANLRGQRENTRMNALQLVNSGSGTNAASAVTEGLKNAFSTANASTKETLFPDLTSNLALSAANQNASLLNAAKLAYAQKSPSIIYPTAASGGRVIQTGPS